MIVTLTPNPSIDRTIEVDSFARGDVLRATASHVDPGGKGINVARVIVANHGKARAVFPCGGAEGDHLKRLLIDAGIDALTVTIDGAVRSNVAVVESDGITTKLNEQGPRLQPNDVAALVDATVAAAESATWVALCGSLPLGVDDKLYATIIERVRDFDCRVAVDSSGAPLVSALAARPALVKPNRQELAQATGTSIRTLGDAVEAATQVQRAGVDVVLASLGADGALLVTSDAVLHAVSVVAHPRSTVGAGDALLAGYLAHMAGSDVSGRDLGGDHRDAFMQGLRWAGTAIRLPASQMPGPDDITWHAGGVDVVMTDTLDRDRALSSDSHH